MTAAAIPIGIGIGSKLLGGIFGHKKKQPSMSDQLDNRYLQALDQAGYTGSDAAKAYTSDLYSFDPTAALEKYGAAASDQFTRGLNRSVQDLKGQAVAAGRLNTGFYDEDVGWLTEDLAKNYQGAMAQAGLSATGMELSRIGQEGAYASDAQNRYLDLLAAAMDRETARKNANKSFWGDLLGAGAAAAGTYFGSRGGG